MSYLVLARKYRPQSFADLVGQEHVSRTLGNAIAGERVHHAFLFTGARGVGKTSAARIFAKSLNCEQGPGSSPCNVCPICREITSGTSVDVLEIDGASNTGVDDVRELRESIRYLPSRARYKIFIIDEVHMLSINAFNALLKTLEEPPPHAKFIFATTEPHKIPATILSRCQRFDFRKIALSQVVARLRDIVTQEAVAISDRSLALVARRGEGSMRDALSALDQVIAFCGEQVRDEEVQALFGQVDRRLLLDAVEAVLQRDGRRALEAVRRVDHLGHSFRQFCRELVEVFRSLTVLKVVDDPDGLLDATPEELAELRGLMADVGLEDLQRTLTLLLKTEAELPASTFPRLTLEMVLIRLAGLPPARDVAGLIRKLEDLERRLGGGQVGAAGSAAVPPAQPPAARVEPPSVNPPPRESDAERAAVRTATPPAPSAPAPAAASAGAPDKGWPGLVEKIRKKKPLLASILEHGSLLPPQLPRLEIAFAAGSFYFEQLKDAEKLEQLEALATEYFGEKVQLRVSLLDGDDPQAPPPLIEERRVQEQDYREQIRRQALEHPKVKAVLEVFGGEIKQVRPLDPTAGTESDGKDEG
ncbi:DNA polymerase III subunit gamma/tau [Geoalkalibacter halelectricus]|uniref:DNA polymerase III subunit gamma/tau n=1 Tax=Geoalkalibacter halelectricus TaxID=2847045 RepID=A0ABY5ZGL4_9BACT|nr:DNA polymerase III subunit gamma/tau [Geoalkalibacter halelectricus]MDO3378017.1 DNA polymerase III subunit gamma/tau [Geoalkalibacter halelectricus]UWZ78317.1 DNA polymerase III subunit gamma/tau [Geoalkalibacter halelectricus]